MGFYRKRPVVIEAMQWDGTPESAAHLRGWASMWKIRLFVRDGEILIPTLEGDMVANPGDWIIRGVQNEFYPCKPDIFKSTYEVD